MHPFFNPRKRKQRMPPHASSPPNITPSTYTVSPNKTSLNTTYPNTTSQNTASPNTTQFGDDNETELKLALLASLHPDSDPEALLDILLAHDGSVALSTQALVTLPPQKLRKNSSAARIGYQSSLRRFVVPDPHDSESSPINNSPKSPTKKRLPAKGSTLHLYDPVDVAELTPCTIIHNFLPPHDANALLEELLAESDTFERRTFKLFDNVVTSPHSAGFYVDSIDEARRRQAAAYHYNGALLEDVRPLTPLLAKVRPIVTEAVNKEVKHRISTRYPGGKKLRHQSPHPWSPNSAFVNLYNGPRESVGWHSDQMTYLGPRAIIGSISLGVAREFRVRRILPKDDDDSDDDDDDDDDDTKPHKDDPSGQISIHLPHNSLLIMHAEMQEEWKHCISPAAAIDPHPISGRRRINITYRDYRASMHPSTTPKCACGVPAVMRVAQKKRATYGRYFWMCHAGNVPGKEGCSFFAWAEFDDDGEPVVGRRQQETLKGEQEEIQKDSTREEETQKDSTREGDTQNDSPQEQKETRNYNSQVKEGDGPQEKEEEQRNSSQEKEEAQNGRTLEPKEHQNGSTLEPKGSQRDSTPEQIPNGIQQEDYKISNPSTQPKQETSKV